MTTIINSLFENLFDLDKSNITMRKENDNTSKPNHKYNDSSISYTKHKYNSATPNPSLEQGYKFIQYQSKIGTKLDSNSAYKIQQPNTKNK
jgi:hypothetical protein